MTIQNAYTNWSGTYDTDRNLTRDLDAEITREVLAGKHYKAVLEIGCGTGKNTVELARVSERVLALDFSEGMLGQAKEKVQTAQVTFAQANLTQPWPCPAGWADFINSNLVLEHIPDLGPIFAEVQRALKVGGQFFVSELHPVKQAQGKQATFKQGDEAILIEAFAHSLSDFTREAETHGLRLISFKELWHKEDPGKPPRLAVFVFEKA
jgi:malonyl-CoA O-methyltransferase